SDLSNLFKTYKSCFDFFIMPKVKKISIPAHYNSLDAPIYIWDRVHSTSDLSWLLIKPRKLTKAITKALNKVWESMCNEFLQEFGVSENYAEILEKTKEIILLRCQYAETNDRTNITWIRLAEDELKYLKSNIRKSDFMQAKIAIE